MDRRTFIRDTGGAALWAAGWPAADVAAVQPLVHAGRRVPPRELAHCGIAVFDPSLVQGRRLARDVMRFPIAAFALEAEADIGALWHAQIAPCIVRRAALAAALRPADAFVLSRLAAAFECRLIGV